METDVHSNNLMKVAELIYHRNEIKISVQKSTCIPIMVGISLMASVISVYQQYKQRMFTSRQNKSVYIIYKYDWNGKCFHNSICPYLSIIAICIDSG